METPSRPPHIHIHHIPPSAQIQLYAFINNVNVCCVYMYSKAASISIHPNILIDEHCTYNKSYHITNLTIGISAFFNLVNHSYI